jgi:hypothetical protein
MPTNINLVPINLRVDGGKMETDQLQDILHFSGVDLKAEADAMMREQDFILSQVAHTSGADPHARANLLFNVGALKAAVALIAEKYQLTNARSWDHKIIEHLLYALQCRLSV